MTDPSHAGPGEGTENPEDVNVFNIKDSEDSHGCPPGEIGLIVLWDGNGYDSDETWLMCHKDAVCDLEYWQ